MKPSSVVKRYTDLSRTILALPTAVLVLILSPRLYLLANPLLYQVKSRAWISKAQLFLQDPSSRIQPKVLRVMKRLFRRGLHRLIRPLSTRPLSDTSAHSENTENWPLSREHSDRRRASTFPHQGASWW